MTDHEAIAFHDDSFRLYFRAWREPAYRGELEMGIPEAAYHALAHAGVLERLGERRPGSGLEHLLDLPQEERARLVRDACEFAADFAVPRHFERFFAQDVLDTDELAEIEGALIQRDEFDAALMAADQVVNEFLASDDDLQTHVVGALDAVRRFDDRLSQRPDILAVASRIVADSTDPAHYGAWLVKARQLDEDFFEPTLRELLPTAAARSATPLLLPTKMLRFQPAETPLQLAAAASDEPFVLKAEGNRELRILCHPRGDLKTLVLLPPPLSRVAAVEVNGKPIDLVKPWDDEGEAVARAEDLAEVFEHHAILCLRLAG